MILDLRLPKMDGLEVLKNIKESEVLRRVPVVVLTTSEAEMDIARAYDHHANSYLVKPLDFQKFTGLMKDFGFYWLAWILNPGTAFTRTDRHWGEVYGKAAPQYSLGRR